MRTPTVTHMQRAGHTLTAGRNHSRASSVTTQPLPGVPRQAEQVAAPFRSPYQHSRAI